MGYNQQTTDLCPLQLTIGVFGYPEYVITDPLSPKVILKLIYDKCLPYDPIEAVLQQEVSWGCGGRGLQRERIKRGREGEF